MIKDKIYKLKKAKNSNMLPSDLSGSLDDSLLEDTFVFIDAGFLSKLSRYFGKGKYLVYDIIKFSEIISRKQNLKCDKIFYYTSPPYQSNNPSTEEKSRKDKYDKFMKKLSEKGNFILREGRCQKIVELGGKPKFTQKGVDTLMTIDLMSVPIKFPNIKKIILLACDSDFVPAIKELREFGLKIILYTYFTKRRDTNFSRSTHLMNVVSRYVKLTGEDFSNAKLEENKMDEQKLK
ncbi:hypothetical protein COT60_00405 [Candidatus Pacearchaeota archaeon CG09_land_8_20_14_0_10_30_9]|nr:MAG: hypothetical protein COV77_04170 [Candidatus Pacearchaeota archaeon CG11_big_fil_rev_8_21_14_0_20_30_13]PIO01453.1 MAG: hypothetical protein COT60_00405 [Candidatus Pacearchaeota archaeon CG09_land_8_20_14_0_10_30_9]PJA71176.1 MAG: hypothetical protein CO153_02935 [Candidatus Pacearchaeota archaeon CG_4_9_14_3_um_filter_30_11]